MNANLKL